MRYIFAPLWTSEQPQRSYYFKNNFCVETQITQNSKQMRKTLFAVGFHSYFWTSSPQIHYKTQSPEIAFCIVNSACGVDFFSKLA